MSNLALFDIEDDGDDTGFIATAGQVLTFKLRAPGLVSSWRLQVYDADGYDPSVPIFGNPPRASKNAPAVDLVGATIGKIVKPTSKSGPVTMTFPAAGVHSYIIRSVVDSGITNGKVDSRKVHQRLVSSVGSTLLRKPVVTELLEFEVDAWAGVISDVVDVLEVGEVVVAGVRIPSVKVASDTPLAESGLYTVQGFALLNGHAYMRAGQADQTKNGIFIASAGTHVRASYLSTTADFAAAVGQSITVEYGDWAHANLSTTGTIIVGTSPIGFELSQPGPEDADDFKLAYALNRRIAYASPEDLNISGAVKATTVFLSNVASKTGTGTNDGYAYGNDELVLLGRQTDTTENGLWKTGTPWTRPTSPQHTPGMVVSITGGAFGGGKLYQMSGALPFTTGTTSQTWRQVDGDGQAGLLSTLTLSQTVMRSVSLPRSCSTGTSGEIFIARGALIQKITWSITASVDAAGVVSLDVPNVQHVDGPILGTIAFSTGTALFSVEVISSSATLTTWSHYAVSRTLNASGAGGSPIGTTYVQPTHNPHRTAEDHVLRYVLPQYWPGIRAGTDTHDHRQAIADCIAGVQATHGMGTVVLSPGVWTIDCSSVPTIIPSGICLRGSGYTSFNGTTIRALGHSRPTTTTIYSSAMVFISSTLGAGLQGVTLDRNNFDGDGLIWINSTNTTIRDIGYSNFNGVKYRAVNSINTSTNTCTGASGTSNILSNNDHVELWVGAQVGDTLPTVGSGAAMAITTGYFVLNKSGNTFQLARTVGGAAIDFTNQGTGTWGFHKNGCTWTSSDTGTNEIGIVQHPFLPGQKVAATMPHIPTLVGSTMPNFIVPQYSYWIVGTPSADKFQVGETPGGTAITVTTAGGLSQKPQWSLEYSPARGSGNLYCICDNWRYTNGPTGYKFLVGEAGGAAYYGINVGRFTNLIGGGGHTFHGIFTLSQSSFEGANVHPMECMLRACGAGATLLDVYIEQVQGTGVNVGVITDGAVTIHGGAIYGVDQDCVNSIAVLHRAPSTVPPTILGCNISDYDYDIALVNPSNFDQGGSDSVQIGNDRSRCLRSILNPHALKSGTTQAHYIQAIRDVGYQFGGTVAFSLRSTTTNPTTVNLGLGNVRQIESNADHTISTITTAGVNGVAGVHGALFCWNFHGTGRTTLDKTWFVSSSGASRTFLPGEAIILTPDGDGKLKIVSEFPVRVAGIPDALATFAANVADQNLFDANPNQGTYAINGYLRVATPATTGTLALQLKFDDTTARTVDIAGTLDVSSGGPGFLQIRSLPFYVKTGTMPTLNATFTGLTGVPSITILGGSVDRIG